MTHFCAALVQSLWKLFADSAAELMHHTKNQVVELPLFDIFLPFHTGGFIKLSQFRRYFAIVIHSLPWQLFFKTGFFYFSGCPGAQRFTCLCL